MPGTHGPAALEARIEAFLAGFAETLAAMPVKEFERNRQDAPFGSASMCSCRCQGRLLDDMFLSGRRSCRLIAPGLSFRTASWFGRWGDSKVGKLWINISECYRASLLASKLQKDRALAEEADRHWAAIFDRR